MVKRFVLLLIRSVVKHNIGALAAIIAFFGFSSLVPVLALLVVVTSLVVPEPAVAQFIQRILQAYTPDIPTARSFALTTIRHLTLYRGDMRVVGIFSLLWSSIGGFMNLQQIMDTIYEVHKRRSFLAQYVIGFAMIGILLALTFASSVFSVLSPFLMAHLVRAGQASGFDVVHSAGKILFPVILLVTCYCCYRILPSDPLRRVPSLIGACLATALIFASRFLFVIYTRHLGNYHVMYGTFTFIMLLTFWIYIVCILLLFGAEFAVTLHRVMEDDGGQQTRA